MYVIKYNDGIYAGTYSDSNGIYCYSSSKYNKKKPKIFMTLKGAEKHLTKLKNSIPFGKDHTQYGFKILEWSEADLTKHLQNVGMSVEDTFLISISTRARKGNVYDNYDNEQEKKLVYYWKSVFKPLKNQEVEISNIKVVDDVCVVSYFMPYYTSNEEYFFQADSDKNLAIDGFCDAVETRANEMIAMISECAKIRNLF